MTLSDTEKEARKKAVFDAMSPRRRTYIDKIGYENWDPFMEPQDPIDLRQDKTKRTSQMLIREFLQARDPDTYSNEYGQGAFKMCLGIINENEKYLGMLDFARWYNDLLDREGQTDK